MPERLGSLLIYCQITRCHSKVGTHDQLVNSHSQLVVSRISTELLTGAIAVGSGPETTPSNPTPRFGQPGWVTPHPAQRRNLRHDGFSMLGGGRSRLIVQ